MCIISYCLLETTQFGILFFMDWFNDLFREFVSLRIFLPFIPLFVAFDALGILPIFVSLTSEMIPSERKKVVRQSILTGFLAGIGFLVLGKSVFTLLGITVSDFKVAGGILLFIISIVDLIFPERTRTFPKETLGIVPIGIPLIVGPGVLTTVLISAQSYGYVSTVLNLILNLLIVRIIFSSSSRVMRVLKEGGTRGLGKIFALLLAAFAMMMIRTGILEWMRIS
jgi:multiple antibiotic resistance protein